MARNMLVYGATGKAGRLVIERALTEGWTVSAFVRNPDKLSSAVRAQVTIVKGDLCDPKSISDAVRSCRPDAIVDASSAIPFGHTKGQPANNADRNIIIKATFAELSGENRLPDCVLLIIGGQLFPEPGGKINSWSVAVTAWLLRNLVIRKAWRETERMLRWCFEGTPPAFRFVYVRMGQMVEAPTSGKLLPAATLNNIQHGAVSYVDVAEALVHLAGDEKRTWERQALFFNYG